MKECKLIIFDADGTLRECTVPDQPCPNGPGEWDLLPNVAETLARYDWARPWAAGVGYGIASNQAGVAYGYLSEAVARTLLEVLFRWAFGWFPERHGMIQMCTHHPEQGCECRKPRPLMIERIMAGWGVRPEDTLYVGDQQSDQEAAHNAGCDFMWADDFFTQGSGETEP